MIERNKYLNSILKFIDTDDILLLYGSRQVGKTTLMKIIQTKYISGKSAFLDLENIEFLNLLNSPIDVFIEYLKLYFGMSLDEKFYLFVDEIQYLDNPTSFLKLIHDHFSNIKVIVSGSSTLEIRGKMKDSLVGRIIKFEIFPLDFKEFLIFKGKEKLLNGIGKIKFDIINKEIDFYYKEFVIWGGYPKVVLASNIEMKKIYLEQIFSLYIEKDIKDIGKIRQVDKFNNLLNLLSNQLGNLLNINELSNTIKVSVQTLQDWILLLQNTFVINLINPYSGNLRSELTKMPKVYFIDTGIRNFILNSFILDGFNFENSIAILIKSTKNKINFWRTQDKKEIDFIVDGNPYEVKLNYDGKKITALDYFENKYSKLGNIITLNKSDKSKYTQFFPWEI